MRCAVVAGIYHLIKEDHSPAKEDLVGTERADSARSLKERLEQSNFPLS